MARPVKRRNQKSLKRDIEDLGRLRTALIMDSSLNWNAVNSAITKIDDLMRALREINDTMPEQKSA